MLNLVLHTVGQFMVVTGIIVPWLVGIVAILTWLVEKIMNRKNSNDCGEKRNGGE